MLAGGSLTIPRREAKEDRKIYVLRESVQFREAKPWCRIPPTLESSCQCDLRCRVVATATSPASSASLSTTTCPGSRLTASRSSARASTGGAGSSRGEGKRNSPVVEERLQQTTPLPALHPRATAAGLPAVVRIPSVVSLLQIATLIDREDARVQVSPDGGQEDVLACQFLVLGSFDRISAATSLSESICTDMLRCPLTLSA